MREKITSCSEVFRDAHKVVRDPKGQSKSEYVIHNPTLKPFSLIRFDGCVFDRSIEKCDYGMEIDQTVYYVELKGTKTNKGLAQLLKTIQETNAVYQEYTKKVRLIVSKKKAPHFIDAITMGQISRLIDSPFDDVNKNFIIEVNTFTENIH